MLQPARRGWVGCSWLFLLLHQGHQSHSQAKQANGMETSFDCSPYFSVMVGTAGRWSRVQDANCQ